MYSESLLDVKYAVYLKKKYIYNNITSFFSRTEWTYLCPIVMLNKLI